MGDGPLAMFPLSTVLFPHARARLHVFEPRYRAMVADCLAADRRFGAVLIARGSEVGGGDQRLDVGTLASIAAAEPLEGGRWLLAVEGLDVLHVTHWLHDAPYPRAHVEMLDGGRGKEYVALRQAETQLRRVRALLAELGESPAPAQALPPGAAPDVAMWRLCELAPLNSFDRQQLLEAPGPSERLALLIEFLRAIGDDVVRILAGG